MPLGLCFEGKGLKGKKKGKKNLFREKKIKENGEKGHQLRMLEDIIKIGEEGFIGEDKEYNKRVDSLRHSNQTKFKEALSNARGFF